MLLPFHAVHGPGMLQFMGSQRARHDWATELNWTERMAEKPIVLGRWIFTHIWPQGRGMNIEQEAASLCLILPFCLPSIFMYSCPQIEVDPSFLRRTVPKFYFGILDSIRSRSHSVVSYSLQPHGLYSPCNSPGQNTGVGSSSLLQGIFPTQGSNPGLPQGSSATLKMKVKTPV